MKAHIGPRGTSDERDAGATDLLVGIQNRTHDTREIDMENLKKEWKTVLMIVWLLGITIYLFTIKSQITQMTLQGTKIASTLDSVESVVITTDASVSNVVKKMDGVESNVSFIVQKIRRR